MNKKEYTVSYPTYEVTHAFYSYRRYSSRSSTGQSDAVVSGTAYRNQGQVLQTVGGSGRGQDGSAADCRGSVSPSADVITLFKAKDASAASRIEEALTTVLDSIKDSTNDYAPEEYAKAKEAEVVNKDNFVYLVICSNTKDAQSVVEASR